MTLLPDPRLLRGDEPDRERPRARPQRASADGKVVAYGVMGCLTNALTCHSEACAAMADETEHRRYIVQVWNRRRGRGHHAISLWITSPATSVRRKLRPWNLKV